MNTVEQENAIVEWANANSPDGTSVVLADQNAARPSLPYVTVKITSQPQQEHAHESAPNSDGNATVENEVAVMASIQCFGTGSKSIMDGLRSSLNKVSVRQLLRAAGLPYIRALSGVTDMTETVGTQFEERAGMDLEFRAVSAVIDNVGVIESVTGTGSTDTGKNDFANNYEIGA